MSCVHSQQWGWEEACLPPLKHQDSRHGVSVHLCSGYSQEVVCYTLGNIPQMPSAPRLVRAGVTWITLQWSRPEGCSPEEVITYTLDIQEDENVSLAHSTPAKHHDILWPNSRLLFVSTTAVIAVQVQLSFPAQHMAAGHSAGVTL